ncbi:protease Lon-related BREX system protein BrxL [Rhizobium leguminosarum bv. viciae]|uniref:Protease Lon-related BREX system protein BrxL n=1 Tax=Rhizobium leguminosarum bv. viciae TaxID=387 RepID=A0A8I2KEG4_RHILV|nr:protease Lon-related BREX system protein BrxL [Rhizobium leguminosarum]NKM43409.1 protease Lon-related BREX system protein BrxL [Rhizobium leguminosarum bv. viciae]
MSNGSLPTRDALDNKANQLFAGKVVRKDLVRKVKVGANVPVFVLEFLLGKYCASSDEIAIQMGLQVVNDTLANNYIRPDESSKAQSKVKENGKYSFIDKVKVRLVDSDYWGEGVNFNNKFLHIPSQYVRSYERLLMGGVWAQVDMRFESDEETRGKNPFWIDKLVPIQIATFDLDEYRNVRKQFTTDEWIDLIVRSMGYEPGEMSRRLKLLFLVRLIPLAERNYNLVELGPRGTGKSYVVQEVSPYTALLTGGTTIANLFGHMSGRQKGMVQIWDVVGFDEVADLQKMPKEVITTMKTYCESGTFQRGQEAVAGDASIAMFGNTNQSIDVMVQTGHLFAPMPDTIRDDMAFIDRLHFYLPGWEIPQMRNELFTDHYGFVVDYLAEALREMRKHNFTEIIDRYFSMGAHLNARDRKAVRKTVSGLMKILFPHGDVTQEELSEILGLALEGRRRVKEQLKKMGSFEYYQTSFSYTLQETGEERFVGVPEQGGRDLISLDPLSPGTVYTAGVTSDGTVGLYRLEVSVSSGTGKLKMAGGVSGAMKESVQRAFSYIQAKKTEFGIGRELDSSDIHVEVIDLLGNRVEAEIGVAFFVASYSALRKTPVSPALLVLGDMSVQGNIKPLRSLTEPLQVAKDNGAKRALIPIENKRNCLDVSGDIIEQVDPIFYGDPKTATIKVLGNI